MLRMSLLTNFVVVLFGFGVNAALLPSYITRCKDNDPQINACLTRSANLAIPHIVKGDVHYNVPNMLPLYLQEITVRNDEECRFVILNAQVHGIEKTRVVSLIYDRPSTTAIFKLLNPALTVLGYYDIYGTLNGRQVADRGFSNITLEGGVYDVEVRLEIRNDGTEKFFRAVDNKANITTQRVAYNLWSIYSVPEYSNLNQWMNENWIEVSKALRPFTNKIVGSFVASVMNGIAGEVPVEEVLP